MAINKRGELIEKEFKKRVERGKSTVGFLEVQGVGHLLPQRLLQLLKSPEIMLLVGLELVTLESDNPIKKCQGKKRKEEQKKRKEGNQPVYRW